ncbi:hypothetical protein C9374_012254 [Naegleria lovaniensis]|uniref:F-box domain-containing protein n=1 Tax=Naegleria lovaniensis TaxID=51637 RepID=A0AA88GDC7_NAELO|nr:uncharacterized protein C9374_012254 [Naegleria lovaniensis]KAG2373388.1 hypothetical protein C9374_012254 [Naegleria lovaniensis]
MIPQGLAVHSEPSSSSATTTTTVRSQPPLPTTRIIAPSIPHDVLFHLFTNYCSPDVFLDGLLLVSSHWNQTTNHHGGQFWKLVLEKYLQRELRRMEMSKQQHPVPTTDGTTVFLSKGNDEYCIYEPIQPVKHTRRRLRRWHYYNLLLYTEARMELSLKRYQEFLECVRDKVNAYPNLSGETCKKLLKAVVKQRFQRKFSNYFIAMFFKIQNNFLSMFNMTLDPKECMENHFKFWEEIVSVVKGKPYGMSVKDICQLSILKKNYTLIYHFVKQTVLYFPEKKMSVFSNGILQFLIQEGQSHVLACIADIICHSNIPPDIFNACIRTSMMSVASNSHQLMTHEELFTEADETRIVASTLPGNTSENADNTQLNSDNISLLNKIIQQFSFDISRNFWNPEHVLFKFMIGLNYEDWSDLIFGIFAKQVPHILLNTLVPLSGQYGYILDNNTLVRKTLIKLVKNQQLDHFELLRHCATNYHHHTISLVKLLIEDCGIDPNLLNHDFNSSRSLLFKVIHGECCEQHYFSRYLHFYDYSKIIFLLDHGAQFAPHESNLIPDLLNKIRIRHGHAMGYVSLMREITKKTGWRMSYTTSINSKLIGYVNLQTNMDVVHNYYKEIGLIFSGE